MINEHDIKDMKPERKFDKGLPLANNHAGFNVVAYEGGVGYYTLEGPFETRGNAEAVAEMIRKRYQYTYEIFVHEALKAK